VPAPLTYRRWYWSLAGDPHRDEHRTMADLTLARDAEAAIEALAYHITRAPSQLIAYAPGLRDLTAPPSRPATHGLSAERRPLTQTVARR
jgi:hypothetical protein